MNVSTATTEPRMKPPSEKASSSSSGEAGEESWSWIAPWNFCWRIERGVVRERVHRPGHHDQAGDHEDHVVEAVELLIREPSAAPKTEM